MLCSYWNGGLAMLLLMALTLMSLSAMVWALLPFTNQIPSALIAPDQDLLLR